MWTYLFDSIELLSNHKSFSLGVDTTRNLWVMKLINVSLTYLRGLEVAELKEEDMPMV
tara:strand:+ start:442 stop:615 length:174 start_codon:yes stop_codon:yes gene_type:complete